MVNMYWKPARRTLQVLTLAAIATGAALLLALPVLANTPGDGFYPPLPGRHAGVGQLSQIGQGWRFYKPVALPPGLAGLGLVELEMDAEVYAHAATGLRDIRIASRQESPEVPYKLLVESGDHRRASVAAKMRDLGHTPGEHTTFTLDLQTEGTLHNELEIKTASNNFQRQVEIESSDDGESWRTVKTGVTIFDFTVRERGFSTSNTRVSYPDSTARFLRVRIDDEGLEPLDISGGVVFFARKLEPRLAVIPLKITERKEDPERKSTVLVLDGGRPGFPANRIDLDVPQRNFHRRVTLEGVDQLPETDDDLWTWHSVQRDETIYDYDTPKFTGNDLSIGFGESRYRYYRVTIANEDNPPLPVEGAQASGSVRKLVFSADPAQSYRLYYGNEDIDAPSYDLEQIFPYLVTEGLPAAVLGPHTENPDFFAPPPSAPARPFTERYPWLLPVIVAIAALVVGAFLASIIRQLRGTLPPPEPPQ